MAEPIFTKHFVPSTGTISVLAIPVWIFLYIGSDN